MAGSCRLGHGAEFERRQHLALGLLLQLPALDGDEAGAEALQAAGVLVAGALVDDALAAELGFQRLDRQAIALDAAVAAALAHQVVDHHAHGRVDHGAALAAAALLGGAGLVVDDDRGALDLAQFALDAVELVAMQHLHARRQLGVGVLLRLVGDDHLARARPRPSCCARSAAPSGPRAARRPAGRRSWPRRRCRGSCR